LLYNKIKDPSNNKASNILQELSIIGI